MRFRFFLTPRFDRTVRKLKRRFPRINHDLTRAFTEIEEDPEAGVIIPDDFAIRKLRIASVDMQRGKSGGFRLLYKLIPKEDEELRAVLLFIYAKADQPDVPSSFLETLSDELPDDDST